MKKYLVAVLALVLALSMGLTACGNKTAEPAVDVDKYVSNVEYQGMPYFIETVEVTDEEVEEELQYMVEYTSETQDSTEGVVEDGDTINVAFVGKIDGEEFEGGSSESYDITVGTTSMIDGFVEGLVGQPIGETVTLNLKFPDDYHAEELQGKDVVFEVTIHSKRITTTPELDDEFAKKYYDLDTLDALREKVKSDLLKSKEDNARGSVKSSLWTILLDKAEFNELPEDLLTKEREEMAIIKEDYQTQATSYGMEWAEFLQTFMGTDEAGFEEMMEESAQENVKVGLLRNYIANKEKVTLTDSEFKDRLKEILESNNLTEENFQSYYNQTIEEYAEAQGWRDSFYLDKVMDKVIELGTEVTQEEYDKYIKENTPKVEEEHNHEGEEGTTEEATEGTTEEATEGTTEETTEEATEETTEEATEDDAE